MSLSDFSKAVALVSEGHCALCDAGLERKVGFTDRGGNASIEARDRYCSSCDVQWLLTFTIEDKPRPMLHTSRPLTSDEIRKLFDRESKP